DPVGEVRPDGAAGRRRYAVELRPARIDAQVRHHARLPGRTDHPEEFLLRVHPDADLGERPVEPAALGLGERTARLPDAVGQPDHGGVGPLGDLLATPHPDVTPHHNHLLRLHRTPPQPSRTGILTPTSARITRRHPPTAAPDRRPMKLLRTHHVA